MSTLRERLERWADETTTTRVEHDEKPYGWTEYTVSRSAREMLDLLLPVVEAAESWKSARDSHEGLMSQQKEIWAAKDNLYDALTELERKLEAR